MVRFLNSKNKKYDQVQVNLQTWATIPQTGTAWSKKENTFLTGWIGGMLEDMSLGAMNLISMTKIYNLQNI